jgi:predicted MFS family arabinose efflux permease
MSMLRPTTLLALSSTVVAMISMFSLVPNIATFVQLNLGYPRERLGLLYLVGGVCSFFTMRTAGWLTDRYGPAIVATGGVSVFALVVYLAFIHPVASIPLLPLFSMFMITSGFRFVPMQALSSRVPTPQERASFMSLQSGVQHMASALGAVISSQLLTSAPNGALIGMPTVAWMSICATTLLPFLLYALQSRLTPVGQGQALGMAG